MNKGFKVDDSTHVKMLIVQEMWKISKSFKYNCKILSCMCLIYYNKWKFVSNGFNILKLNGLILIIEKMWIKTQIHSNINVGFWIVTSVLIDYYKCKM